MQIHSKKEKSIKLIAALSDNDVIGLDNGELPWILPGDLRHFKDLTTGNTIVMGWNTWKSIGEKPLPNRINVILSRKVRQLPRSKWIYQIKNPIDIFKLPKHKRKGDIFIIGGGQVYSSYMSMIDEMYLTYVHLNIPYAEKHIKFPKVDWYEWTSVEDVDMSDQEENGIVYEFRHYARILD